MTTLRPISGALLREVTDLAQLAFQADRYDSCAALCRYLLWANPSHFRAWFWLGRCHQELGEPDFARQLFEAAALLGNRELFDDLAQATRELPSSNMKQRR